MPIYLAEVFQRKSKYGQQYNTMKIYMNLEWQNPFTFEITLVKMKG